MLDIKDMFIRQRQKTDKELYQYLYNNKDGLKPYQSRGIELPELGEGLKYGSEKQLSESGPGMEPFSSPEVFVIKKAGRLPIKC